MTRKALKSTIDSGPESHTGDARPGNAMVPVPDNGRPREPYKVSIDAEPTTAGAMVIQQEDLARRLEAFGTASVEFANQSLGRVAAIARGKGEAIPTEQALNAGLAAVDGLQPRDEVEGMLAIQMYATHEVAMEMLTRAKLADSAPGLQNCSSIAIKLLRTYTAQIEALAKLRRGGEQTVRVEHAHIYPGAQAVVGSVTHHSGGSAPNAHKGAGSPSSRAPEVPTEDEL